MRGGSSPPARTKPMKKWMNLFIDFDKKQCVFQDGSINKPTMHEGSEAIVEAIALLVQTYPEEVARGLAKLGKMKEL